MLGQLIKDYKRGLITPDEFLINLSGELSKAMTKVYNSEDATEVLTQGLIVKDLMDNIVEVRSLMIMEKKLGL